MPDEIVRFETIATHRRFHIVIVEDAGALVVELDAHITLFGERPPNQTIVFEVEFLDDLPRNVRVTVFDSLDMQ